MRKLTAAICGVFILILIIYFTGSYNNHAVAGNESDAYEYEYYYSDTDNKEDSMNSISVSDEPATKESPKIDTDPDSITVFVNKEYSLPAGHVPSDLTRPDVKFYGNYSDDKRYLRKKAANALEDLFSAAEKDGVILYGVSGYRSYSRQKEIYNNNIEQRGSSATNKVSAAPGHSEHQTGLAIDISNASLGCTLSEEFGNSKEGKWVAKHCAEYGYIIRYPKNKEKITGYSYEPWHIRYVGKKTAKYISKNNITFEEFFGYTPSSLYESDIISDKKVNP